MISATGTRTYTVGDLRRSAEAGIRAPSLLDSQPWLFRLHDGSIEVRIDPTRQSDADRSGWAARLACGAATYNARLALATTGRPATVQLYPDPADGTLVARLTPGGDRPPTYAERDLYAAVPRRYSNRTPFWPDPVPAEVRSRLIEAARTESAWLDLLVGMTALTAFSEIAFSADRVLRRDSAHRMELISWTHADTAADGVPAGSRGLVGEPPDRRPPRAFTGRRTPARDYEPEPLLGVLGVAGDRAIDQVTAGQALQRVLLTATDAGLYTSMISQPIEVPAARDQLRRSLGRTGYPQIAIRVGYGAPGHAAPHRDLAEVLSGGLREGERQ